MSIYSDLAIVLKDELYQEVLKNKSFAELIDCHDEIRKEDGYTLLSYESIKFYTRMDTEWDVLLEFLRENHDGEYYFYEVCSEHTSTDSFGYIEDMPFNIGYSMSLDIY